MATLKGGNSNGSLTGDIGTPAAGDIVILRDGSGVYDSGLDISTNEIDSLVFAQDFVGTVGAAGSSLLVDLSATTHTGLLEYRSRGAFAYIAATTEIQTARIYQTGTLGVFFTAGTVSSLEVLSGSVEFNSSTDVPSLSVAGGFVKARDHATQAIDTLDIYGGRCQCERNIGTANVYGGELNVIDASVTATTVNVGTGGVFRHVGGDIGTLVAKPGATIDLSGVTEDITITNATRWPGVTYMPPPQGITVTVSTPTEILGGGTFAT